MDLPKGGAFLFGGICSIKAKSILAIICEVTNMDSNSAAVFSAYVAGVSAVLSLTSIGWNWYVFRKDRPEVTIRAMIAKKVPDPTDQDYLAFTITNVGRRPVQITHLCGKYSPWWGPISAVLAKQVWVKRLMIKLNLFEEWPEFFIVTKNIPCKLEEGSYIIESNPITDDTMKTINRSKLLYAIDSTGRDWTLPRGQLKKLQQRVRDLAKERNVDIDKVN